MPALEREKEAEAPGRAQRSHALQLQRHAGRAGATAQRHDAMRAEPTVCTSFHRLANTPLLADYHRSQQTYIHSLHNTLIRIEVRWIMIQLAILKYNLM